MKGASGGNSQDATPHLPPLVSSVPSKTERRGEKAILREGS